MCVRFSTNLKDHGSAALGTELHRLCPQWVSAQVVRHGESVLYVHPQYIRSFLLFCRDSMLYQIKACIDLCCVDYPFREHRFTLVYMLCSVHSPGRKTLVRRSVTYGGLGLAVGRRAKYCIVLSGSALASIRALKLTAASRPPTNCNRGYHAVRTRSTRSR